MTLVKKFLKDSTLYGFGSLVSKAIAFFLIPYITRILTPSEYGIYDLLITLYSLLALILPLEVSQSIARYSVEWSHDQKREYYSTGLNLTLIMFFGFGLLFLYCEPLHTALLNTELERWKFRGVFALGMIANAYFYYQNTILRWENRPQSVMSSNLIQTVIYAVATISLLSFFHLSLLGLVMAYALSHIVASAYLLVRTHKIYRWAPTLSLPRLRLLLDYSLPLVLSGVFIYIVTFTDRWMINYFLSTASVGIYSVTFKYASISLIVIQVLHMALSPLILQNYRDPYTVQVLIDRALRLLTYLLVAFWVFAFLFGRPVFSIILPKTFPFDLQLFLLLSTGAAFQACYFFFPGLTIAKKTKHIASINLISAAINLGLNILLIPKWGILGAGVSTLASGILTVFLYWYFGQNEFRVRMFHLSRVTLFLMLGLMTIWVSLSLEDISMKAFLFVSYLMFSFFVLFPKNEISKIVSLSYFLNRPE